MNVPYFPSYFLSGWSPYSWDSQRTPRASTKVTPCRRVSDKALRVPSSEVARKSPNFWARTTICARRDAVQQQAHWVLRTDVVLVAGYFGDAQGHIVDRVGRAVRHDEGRRRRVGELFHGNDVDPGPPGGRAFRPHTDRDACRIASSTSLRRCWAVCSRQATIPW